MRDKAPDAALSAPLEPVRRVAVGPWRAELLPRGAYDVRYVADRSITGFAFDPQTGVHAFGGDRRTGYRARPNGLARVPVGCDVYSRSDTGGEYLRIIDSSGSANDDETRFSGAIDARAIAAAHALRRELLATDVPDLLACERLVLALRERAAAVAGRPPTRASGWMTTRRLALVDEMIETRLDGALTVHELAAALGLSDDFFTRAFRASTGCTPHAWVMERRLARARALLLGSTADIAAIAADCGFASHSHLTARFRACYGTTPSRFRSGRRACTDGIASSRVGRR